MQTAPHQPSDTTSALNSMLRVRESETRYDVALPTWYGSPKELLHLDKVQSESDESGAVCSLELLLVKWKDFGELRDHGVLFLPTSSSKISIACHFLRRPNTSAE